MNRFKLFIAAVGIMLRCPLMVVAADVIPVVPSPKSVIAANGRGLDPLAIRFVVAEGCRMPVLYGALDELPQKHFAGNTGIHLILDSAAPVESSEGYSLDISQRGAVVRSRTEAGLFYGAITLSQLISDAKQRGSSITPMTIVDSPSHPVRAVHFDTKHHLDRSEYYYTLIDRLAQWKVNCIIWELEDKLRYEKHPECSSPNAMSKQEVKAIADYAYARHIRISPLVQGLGHAGYILKNHCELRENQCSDWEMCPSNPGTYSLLFDLYAEAMEALPHGEFLHIGGDEISQIGIDSLCVARDKSPFELQMEWLSKVCDFAIAHGRTPIFWDDMPLKYGGLWGVIHGGLSDRDVDDNWHTDKLDETINLFPRDCIYMRWHYNDPTIYPHLKVLNWYKDKGLRVMAATAAADGGSPYMPRHGSKIEHIRSFCRLAIDNNLGEGVFATCWDDGSPHWETVMRGFAALGEYGWNPKGRNADDFKEAFARSFFGLYAGETSFIEPLEEAANFFDGALIVEGRRNPAWQVRGHRIIDLPDPTAPGKWSKAYAARLDSAKKQLERCEKIEDGIYNAISMALRNRYALEIYLINNRLFKFPAELLTALERYDTAGGDAAATDRLNQLLEDFSKIKQTLISTYGRTRFMELPPGYIMDMNHHSHLAALRPDASWLFLYEDEVVNQLRELLK